MLIWVIEGTAYPYYEKNSDSLLTQSLGSFINAKANAKTNTCIYINGCKYIFRWDLWARLYMSRPCLWRLLLGT